MTPIISAENLGKCYLIGHQTQRQGRSNYVALRDVMVDTITSCARHFVNAVKGKQLVRGDELEEFWALRDVSFDIKRGEAVGIIGHNGAGKSTLLKILSRITEPSQGQVTLRGRVASLLEVGTGFHPELTGRENIFLNGAILGMQNAEIRKKFDEIVDFAGVERFLDTPVKRYSSGMYVRLAFAVAAHLEPEILVVDEVLAVGDAEFQRKCLGKMEDVAKGGRTVLFVSHNMGAILQLTKRCILLKDGIVAKIGSSQECVEIYSSFSDRYQGKEIDLRNARRTCIGTLDLMMVSIRLGNASGIIGANEPINFFLTLEAKQTVESFRTSLTIFRSDGTAIGSGFSPENASISKGEIKTVRISIHNHHLVAGHYYIGLSVGKGNHFTQVIDFDVVTQTLPFEIQPAENKGGLARWSPGWGSTILKDISQTVEAALP